MSATVVHASSITQPTSAQDHFIQSYDLDNPVASVNDYARMMHLHTKRQMESATDASRCRAADAVPALASEPSVGSQSSTDSQSSV